MRIALLGHMGRDPALAENFVKHGHEVHVIGVWPNPTLYDLAAASGGQLYDISSVTNVRGAADWVERIKPDMFLTNFDNALAAGVCDAVEKRGLDRLLLPVPNKKAAMIEWDKFYLRELVHEIDPSFNPPGFRLTKHKEVAKAVAFFEEEGWEVAIKPRNLTGGKGVKVMGKHFQTLEQAAEYAHTVLDDKNQQGVEIQKKIAGYEFTLQLFTDGMTMVLPPETYDYPYRRDGDTGPGTGGMGAFSMAPGEHLPFVDQADYDAAVGLMRKILVRMKADGIDYKGILYPTFFKTPDGLRIVEVNARGGDPELINIADLAEPDVDFGDVYRQIAQGELQADSIRYQNQASAMVYLVHPGYENKEYTGPRELRFDIDHEKVAQYDVRIRFAAGRRLQRHSGNSRYKTAAESRVVGLSALGDTPWDARAKIIEAIEAGFSQPLQLEYRRDIANKAYIQAMYTRAA